MDKRYDNKKDLAEPYGAERFPVKSCGKRHGFCKVCRPDIGEKIKNTFRHKKDAVGLADATSHLAPGYVPHPTKTMWERHAEMYNIDPQLHTHPYLHVGSLKSKKEQREEIKQVVEESKLKEGEEYSDYELSRIFGFDRYTIITFRESERLAKKEKIQEAKRKAREEKRKHIAPREKLILELRLDKEMTLDAIAAQCDPPITRERVRQILQNIERKAGIKIPSYPGRPDKDAINIPIAVHCKVCGKIMETTEKKAEHWRNHFCDEHKMSELDYSRYLQDPEYLTLRLSEASKQRWIYHNDPHRKAQLQASNKRYRDRRDNDPVKDAAHKQKFNAYLKEYWKKKKEEKNKKRIRPFIETDGD